MIGDVETQGGRHCWLYRPETVFRSTSARGVRGAKWRFIGHVGAGFSREALRELHGKLINRKISIS
jgi:hypothetical protein